MCPNPAHAGRFGQRRESCESVRRKLGGFVSGALYLMGTGKVVPAFEGSERLSGWLSYGCCSSFRAPVATWSRKACGKPPALRSLLLPLLALPFSATGGGRARPPASLSAAREVRGATAEGDADQIGFVAQSRNSRSRANDWKLQQNRGPRENPAQRFSWGEDERRNERAFGVSRKRGIWRLRGRGPRPAL